jgi:dTDP-4-dehydrorhamnose 3,5-epimerase
MGNFQFTETAIPGVVVVEPAIFGDARGFFMETYNEEDFHRAGITARFVQDNQSSSVRGVLRGLHFQKRFPQAKLVRVLSGEVFDVAVDIRPGSSTWGQWVGAHLSAENRKQLIIPRGLAHAFLVLSDTAQLAYKCDELYHPQDEGGIIYNDPTIGIAWPLPADVAPILSEKDAQWPSVL